MLVKLKDNCREVSDWIIKEKLDNFILLVVDGDSMEGEDVLNIYNIKIEGMKIICKELEFGSNDIEDGFENNLDWLDCIVENWYEGNYNVSLCKIE